MATGEPDTWTYTYRNHAVTRITSSKNGIAFSFSYDATGNMTEKTDLLSGKTKQMAYGSNNRIQEVTLTPALSLWADFYPQFSLAAR